jgi:hypothetical protein
MVTDSEVRDRFLATGKGASRKYQTGAKRNGRPRPLLAFELTIP